MSKNWRKKRPGCFEFPCITPVIFRCFPEITCVEMNKILTGL